MVNLKYLSAMACAVLLIVFTTSTSWAQSVSSSQVSGVVRDSSGGALPGADVTITKIDTGRGADRSSPASMAPTCSPTCLLVRTS